MKKTTLGVAAAVTTLVALPAGVAHADAPTLQAASFAELLEPIPNASAELSRLDSAEPAYQAMLMKAQYDRHHHHHHGRRTTRSSNHHHHHENGNYGRRTRAVSHHHHHHDRNRRTSTRSARPYGERG